MVDILSIIQQAEAVEVGTDLYEHKYSFKEVSKIIKHNIKELKDKLIKDLK